MTVDVPQLPIIASKLAVPPRGPDLFLPEELVGRLEPAAPVTVVVAPAGSGKTTLLAAWLSRAARPLAWLSLDALDDEPSGLVIHLLAALRTVDPSAGARTQVLMTHGGAAPPPWTVVTRSLLQDMEAMAAPFALVLDDIHVLQDPDCLALVSELILRRPAPMRLAIASRAELPLPLARLEAEDVVRTVGLRDLQWSPRASAAYVMRVTKGRMDWATARRLAAESDGWIAALRLAALYTGQGGAAEDVGTVLRGPGPNWRALEYLADEVLDRQAPRVQDFLQRASILDRFCMPLCAALSGAGGEAEGDAALLEHALQEHLFILPLDGEAASGARWYRFHHLFRELLARRLRSACGPDEIAALHARAAAWLRDEGFVEEALRHMLANGDDSSLVALLEARRHEAMDRDGFLRLERWLRPMPRALVDRHPELVLCEAWTFLNRYRWEDLPERVERAAALLEDGVEAERVASLQAEVETLRGQICFREMDLAAAAAHATRALELAPREHATVRGVARTCLGGCLFASGDPEGSTRVFYEGLKEQEAPDGNPTLSLVGLSFMHWMHLDLSALRRTAARLLALGATRGLPASLGWGHYFRACARYAAGDLGGAREDFGLVAERRVLSSGATFSQGVFGLATTCLALGEPEEALSWIEQLFAHALETLNTELEADAQVFRALLSLRLGDPEDALRRIGPYVQAAARRPMYLFYVTPLLLVRIVSELPSPELSEAVTPLLDGLLALSGKTNNLRVRAEALALAAIRDELRGDGEHALERLEAALDLAEPSGFTRLFADLRPALDPLMARLETRGNRAGFVQEIAAATPFVPTQGLPGSRRGLEVSGVQPATGPDEPTLRDRLTFRELDVLVLICERKTNREIAHELGISPETVKSHAANLYRKLEVDNRREAAALARREGLDRR